MVASEATAQGYGGGSPTPPSEQQDKLKPYAQIITDLRERGRRVVHTEYPVSAKHGLLRGFVHVSDGTAVLARTDLVIDASLPIIVRRTYHSSRESSLDFGAGGWRLSFEERIEERPNGRFFYTYGNGTRLELDRQGRVESPLDAYLSDVTGARVLDASRLQISTRTGLKKVFRRRANTYLLAAVTDGYGNRLDFRYSHLGMLVGVNSSSGVGVKFTRDERGRLESIEDSHGRVVTYTYDAQGRLAAVVDASGQPWKYSYDSANRLTSTLTPNETVDMEFHYDGAGRVVSSRANGARFSFAYSGQSTAVTDEQGLTTSYTANASGLTSGVTNALGTRTGLRLSKSGVPTGLLRNEELVVDFTDGSPRDGALNVRLHAGGRSYLLTYDRQHRVVRAASSDGSTGFEVESYSSGLSPRSVAFFDATREEVGLDARGELARLIKRDGTELSFKRTGQTWRIQGSAGRRADLRFDTFGRLISTESGNQKLAFTYNDQGLRESTESTGGWGIRYRYDASGNLYYAGRDNGDGSSLKSTYMMREDRRLEGIAEAGGAGYQFAYGPLGELSEIRAGESVTARFEYDEFVRLKRVQHRGSSAASTPTETIDYNYSPGEADIAAQLSMRTLPLFSQQKEISAFASRFDTLLTRIEPAAMGLLTYDTLRGELALAADPSRWSPLGHVTQTVAGLRVEALLAGDRASIGDFIIPANRLFVPPEYWTVNCCVCPCPPSDPNCPPYSECEACTPPPCLSVVGITSPPNNPSPSDANWQTNYSFLSSANVVVQATVFGSQPGPEGVVWSVQPSGAITNFSPNGDWMSFRPVVLHPPYGSGGSTGTGSALSYAITASICFSQSNITITQDVRDVLRQEYVNHGISVPGRGALAAVTGTANFSASEISQSAYPLLVGNPGQLGEAVRAQYNTRIRQQLNNPAFPAQGLAMSSGWRNPERNEAVGGVVNSVHQYGNAVDLKILSSTVGATGLTAAQLWTILEAAGDSLGNAFCERQSSQIACTDPEVTHVHVQN